MSKKLPNYHEMRDQLFADALAKHNGHYGRASSEIGVDFSTLYRWKMKKDACKLQVDEA